MIFYRLALVILFLSGCNVSGEGTREVILDDNPSTYVKTSSVNKVNYVVQQRDLKGRKGKSSSGKSGTGKGHKTKSGGTKGIYYGCDHCEETTNIPMYYVQYRPPMPTCAPNPINYGTTVLGRTMTPYWMISSGTPPIPTSMAVVPPWYPIYFPAPSTITGQTSMPFPYIMTTTPPNPGSISIPMNSNPPVPPWYPIYFPPYATVLPEQPVTMPAATLPPTTTMPQYIPPPPIPMTEPPPQAGFFPTSAPAGFPSINPNMMTMPPEMQPVPYASTHEPTQTMPPREQRVPYSTGEPIPQNFIPMPIPNVLTTPLQEQPLPANTFEPKSPVSIPPMVVLPLTSLAPQGSVEQTTVQPSPKTSGQLTFLPTPLTPTTKTGKTVKPVQSINNTQPSVPKNSSLPPEFGAKQPIPPGNVTEPLLKTAKPASSSKNSTAIQIGKAQGLDKKITSFLDTPEIPPQDYPRSPRQWDVVLT